MIQQVIDRFELTIHHRLEVMRHNQTLASLTARLLEGIDEVLEKERPALSVVQGDTTTVLAASLASFYRQIPIAHVEAGLRTGNLHAPFPEEANRILAGHLADIHFAPTETARDNLLREGIAPDRIHVCGNTVIDALHYEIARQEEPAARASIDATLDGLLGTGWRNQQIVLITGHRRESFGARFQQICDAIGSLAESYPSTYFVYPVHLNPNVREPVFSRLGELPNVHLLEPLPYDAFVALLQACKLVLTDSGGVQEEAPGLGKPVLVMREATERPEGVALGCVRLVGTTASTIGREVRRLLDSSESYAAMSIAGNPYGDGKAGRRIAKALEAYVRALGPWPAERPTRERAE
jgi:UDP-N-acetylglucosamine 2-epimerase (non-hydrolysing)